MAEHFVEEQTDQASGSEFQPGWPALFPSGFISARLITQALEVDHEPGVSWTIRGGVAEANTPRVAFVGELSVITGETFSGHTVVMPVWFRDEPDLVDHDFVDAQLEQYAEWVSPMLYDFAAQGLRAMVSGFMGSGGVGIGVPNLTPDPHVILFRDVERDREPDDSGQPGTDAASFDVGDDG